MQDKIKTLFALKKLPIKWDRFLWNSPVFLFANENIAEYIDALAATYEVTDPKGKLEYLKVEDAATE